MNSRLHSRHPVPQAPSPRYLSCSAHSTFSVISALNSSSLRFSLPPGKSSTLCTVLVQCKSFRINTCKSASKQTALTFFRINTINTYEKHRGDAVDSALLFNVPRSNDSSIYPLSFHILAHSFALSQNPTLLFSSNSALFRKNTRGWGCLPPLQSASSAILEGQT